MAVLKFTSGSTHTHAAAGPVNPGVCLVSELPLLLTWAFDSFKSIPCCSSASPPPPPPPPALRPLPTFAHSLPYTHIVPCVSTQVLSRLFSGSLTCSCTHTPDWSPGLMLRTLWGGVEGPSCSSPISKLIGKCQPHRLPANANQWLQLYARPQLPGRRNKPLATQTSFRVQRWRTHPLFSLTNYMGAGRGLCVGLVMCVYTLCPQMGKTGIREDGAGCGHLPHSGALSRWVCQTLS